VKLMTIIEVMRDLPPRCDHADAGPVSAAKPSPSAGTALRRPDEFDEMKAEALAMGFTLQHAARLFAPHTMRICRRKAKKLNNAVIFIYSNKNRPDEPVFFRKPSGVAITLCEKASAGTSSSALFFALHHRRSSLS
jgi:hypothetical protein